ncbi:hypothetical protein BDB00DRAFT_328666 [Zychaea mexicana]|uniref:uncharacterized protein n=1 Tax=Zychaea mexicana TaxID=64656 RepID=UPI0022FE32D5|nr:uncharacterized protein BDB00DRAFT_328666 [Zychaea mexicana]KAI9498971.1 hypothetical protein BDB00DRAFT_328666 [Zychaea mexicana]
MATTTTTTTTAPLTPKQTQAALSASAVEVDDDESFVKFEDDEETPPPPNSKKTTESVGINTLLTPTLSILQHPQQQQQLQQQLQQQAAKMATGSDKPAGSSADVPSPLDLLKALSIPNLNIAALQQLTAAIPGLAHLSSTFDLAKTLAAYLQSLNKPSSSSSSSSSSSTPSSSSSSSTTPSPNFASDFKAALARFPALETLLLRKDPSTTSSPTSTTANNNNNNNNPTPSIITSTPTPTPTSTTTSTFVNTLITDPHHQQIVHTTMPTNPPMYITIVDNIPVCVAVLAPTDSVLPECRIMRRLDSGYINGTKLLTAGGIDTESERSMILSFEMERRRMPRKKSELYGTWIPLRRAQELAVTCSIQHRLGPFLSDSIESYFPSPLPINVPIMMTPRRTTVAPPAGTAITSPFPPTKDSRLASLTLQALRANSHHGASPNTATPDGSHSGGSDDTTTATADNGHDDDDSNNNNNNKNGKVLLPRSLSPPSQTTSAAQLHQFLLSNNPRKFVEFAQKAPLLGTFEDDDDDDVEDKRTISVIDRSAKPVPVITTLGAKTSNNKRKRKQSLKETKKKKKQEQEDDESSDVDIVNSSDSDDRCQEEEEDVDIDVDEDDDDEDADTDTDTDVEEVRLRMKRMRDAAIDAMESGSSIDLEELLRRASSPIMENPRRAAAAAAAAAAAQHATTGNRLSTTTTTGFSSSPLAGGSSSSSMRRHGKATARRRPQGPGGRSIGGKIAPSALKKSASWSGSLTSPLRVVVPTKKLHNKKHSTRPSKLRQHTAADELLANRVVEHTPAITTSSSSSSSTTTTATTSHADTVTTATTTTPANTINTTTTVTPTSTASTAASPSPPAPSQAPDAAPSSASPKTSGTDVLATIQEDDEDEEIDIGGSEEDDDLR